METLALYAIKGGDGGGGSGSGDVTGVKGSAESTYRKGNVSISAANIGLGNVNNTADADKPVSTATQTALDGKVDKVTGKGLSTNDYDATAKTKLDALANIQSIGTGLTLDSSTHQLTATGASIDIDDELSGTSVNPVQNKVITAALGDKISKSSTAGLVKNDGTIDTDTFVKTSSTTGLLKNDGTVDTTTYVSDISGKADKVTNSTNGNFAGLDSSGNITDSGSKASDFLTQHQDISGKQNKTLDNSVVVGGSTYTTVETALGALATASGGSSGHTIENSAGTDMTARTNLQFLNCTVADDSTNNRTKVTPANISTTTTDPGEGSVLTTNCLLIVVEE